MTESRFQIVLLLHDLGDNPYGQVEELRRILAETHPNVIFVHPPVSEDFNSLMAFLTLFQPNSLVVGLGLGGLFASVMQERFPYLNLSVFAVNPPMEYERDGASGERVSVGESTGQRIVLYSSQYEPLRGEQPEQWSKYCDLVFDVPWLSEGVQKAFYSTSYLISAFMRGRNMPKEVASVGTAKEEV